MNFDYLNKKYEEFIKKFSSNNLHNLIDLENEIIEFLKKNNKNKETKFRRKLRKIRQLLAELYEKNLILKSKLKKSNKYYLSNEDDYIDKCESDNYIEGTNYVIYGSDLDPLEPEQDLLDFCN